MMDKKLIEANYHYSLTWKECSKELFDNAKTKEDFFQAFIWCGFRGNVARTISKDEREKVAYCLFENLSSIKNGTFNIFSDIPVDCCKKNPTSWISKVCHIINPKQYPLIWDSVMKNSLKLSKENWKEKCQEEIKKTHLKTETDFYKNESEMWACNRRNTEIDE